MGLFSLLETFSWNIGKQIIANLTKELLFRSIVMILIALWVVGWVSDFDEFIGIYAYSYLPLVLLLALVIASSKQYHLTFSISKLTKRLYPTMARFGGAYFFSSLLNVVAKTNDTIIIASQSTGGLADAAIFTIATYLVTVMEVPQRSVVSAATPQIAQAWKDHDIMKLDRLYTKTALNLLIVACGILGIIFLCTPLLLQFLGQPYKAVPLLLLILGFSKLIDLGTGMNSQILQLSKHWRIDLFTNILFVGVSIVLNYFLTKAYGITGTAAGSLISIVAFNGIRFIYIKKIYNLQPFSSKNLLTLLAASSLTLVLYMVDLGLGVWFESIGKSIVFVAAFGGIILGFNVSPDLTELFKIIQSRLRSKEK
jgi:O-antigen/teichoic acid export membrane protein